MTIVSHVEFHEMADRRDTRTLETAFEFKKTIQIQAVRGL
jgi:hypothetical protein